MGSNTKSREIEHEFDLDSGMSVKFYTTGLLTVTELNRERPFLLHMTNTRSLFEQGYLLKLLTAFESVAKLTGINNLSKSTRDDSNNFGIKVDYNDDVSGITVRNLLDDESLTEPTKFSAIMSLLLISPALTVDEITPIIAKQTPPENIKGLKLWRTTWFLAPDFDSEQDGKYFYRYTYSRLTTEEFFKFHKLAGFFTHSLHDETYSDYAERMDGDYFHPQGSDSDQVKLALDQVNSKIFEDLNKTQMMRFINLSEYVHKSLQEFLKDRILLGEVMDAEIIEDSEPGITPKRIRSSFRSLMTKDEVRALKDYFHERDSSLSSIAAGMGIFAASTLAYYSIKAGPNAVVELMNYIRSNPEHGLFFNAVTTYRITRNSKRVVTPKEFMLALDDEYKDLPLAWSLNLIAVEVSSKSKVTKSPEPTFD